ncbi:unnamed protein product [Blepharisma stoltei]|uniref:Uncharacterized protein n=1 Tax=Blepharisma stoltei TaxID=1481888 RepID=A0AAU9K4G6_9CILI|nr:unnamed protein product [Blepharisma stoltei]
MVSGKSTKGGHNSSYSSESLEPPKSDEVESERSTSLIRHSKTKYKTKKIKDFYVRNEDGKSLNIRPRFDSECITDTIEAKIKEIKKIPMDYYEVVLYDLCRKYNTQLSGFKVSPVSISTIHHVYRLKSIEQTLSCEQKSNLKFDLDSLLNSRLGVYQEYLLFAETLKFISAVAIKWGVINIDNYAYRITGRGLNIKLLDLHEINSDFFTMETLWLSMMTDREPLRTVVDDEVSQYASLLANIACQLVNDFLSLNQNCDFERVESIASLAAAKTPEITQYTGIEANPNAESIDYQTLRFKSNIFCFCIKKPQIQIIKSIKNLLIDFETVYRQFEKNLMANILIAFHLDNQ